MKSSRSGRKRRKASLARKPDASLQRTRQKPGARKSQPRAGSLTVRGPKPDATDDPPKIGAEMRALRKERGMTLTDLSRASGLSVSFLSQVERDASNLSVTALYKASKALGVNISWFFHAQGGDLKGEHHYVVRAERRRHLRYASGVFDELLVPHLNGALAMFLIRFPSGAVSGDAKVAPNSEHAGLILEGQLELCLDGTTFLLEAGDSFSFPGSVTHRYGNPGRVETVDVWALTPPSY